MKGEARKLIAANVRALRALRQMTQEDIAGVAEMDRSYISLIENERFSVSVDQIEKLAAALHVEIYELFHPDTAMRAEGGAI